MSAFGRLFVLYELWCPRSVGLILPCETPAVQVSLWNVGWIMYDVTCLNDVIFYFYNRIPFQTSGNFLWWITKNCLYFSMFLWPASLLFLLHAKLRLFQFKHSRFLFSCHILLCKYYIETGWKWNRPKHFSLMHEMKWNSADIFIHCILPQYK